MTTKSWVSLPIVYLVAPIMLFATTFPYTPVMSPSSYTQPQGLLLGTLLFFFSTRAILKLRLFDRIAILGLGIAGSLMFILNCGPYDTPQEYKYLLVYLSPLLMVPVFVTMLKKNKHQVVWILQASIIGWFLVSAGQVFLTPSFATNFLGGWGAGAIDIASSGRGVLGLAPEPTHHAFHILLLGASLLLLDDQKLSRILGLGCIVSAVFFAASATAIVVLLFAAVLWLLRYKANWFLALAVCGWGIWEILRFVPNEWLPTGFRAIELTRVFIDNPASFLMSDYSVNVRLGGLVAILLDSVQSGFLPNGMSHNSWLDSRLGILHEFSWLVNVSEVGPPSGFGLIIYQGGILTIPFVLVMLQRLVFCKPTTMIGQILLFTVVPIFFSQFYISAPMFSLVYGCMLYRFYLRSRFAHATPLINSPQHA